MVAGVWSAVLRALRLASRDAAFDRDGAAVSKLWMAQFGNIVGREWSQTFPPDTEERGNREWRRMGGEAAKEQKERKKGG